MIERGPGQGGEGQRPDEILRAFVDGDLDELREDLRPRMTRDPEDLTDAHLNPSGEPSDAANRQPARNVFDKIVYREEKSSEDSAEDDQ